MHTGVSQGCAGAEDLFGAIQKSRKPLIINEIMKTKTLALAYVAMKLLLFAALLVRLEGKRLGRRRLRV